MGNTSRADTELAFDVFRAATANDENAILSPYSIATALSMVYAVLGAGAVSAINVGQPGANVVRLRFADHRDIVLTVGTRDWMRAGYQITLYGTKGWSTVQPDLKNLYLSLIHI